MNRGERYASIKRSKPLSCFVASGGDEATMSSLDVLSARLQQTFLAIQYMDTTSRVELFSLVSFACCIVGAESDSYMLSSNLAVALLGLICCRGASEAQLVGLCVFSLFTTLTDVRVRPRMSDSPPPLA